MQHHDVLHRVVFGIALSGALGLAGTSRPAGATPRTSVHAFAKPALEGTLNLNEATAEQLVQLPGIGPATAAKIIAYRQSRPFRSVAQLMRIKGIGRKTYVALRRYLTVEGDSTLRAKPSP